MQGFWFYCETLSTILPPTENQPDQSDLERAATGTGSGIEGFLQPISQIFYYGFMI